ncbi:EAL domain-containing response regulator [Leptolyngbya sp. CCY15150]|uniref:EAL domain-containing response regulator n=1 Tax=Leptolyngbya sp. CCY15150 TaxID=2767772 RepID=UPI00194E2F52|nr:EAL domain-containing response regulator [Leptolyngbya sp. CCY15150]
MSPKKILVIEDEPMLRDLISDLLEAECYEPICAEDGISGLQMARDITPDLILCDVMLPGIDGYGILAALQQEVITAAVPFIFLTAKSERLDIRHGMALGADDYITKPFDRLDLLDTIRTRLKKQAALHQAYGNASEGSHTQIEDRDRLLKALEQDEFSLYYQPQISLQTGELVGAEALIRWHDPQRGLVPPNDFIPLAESTGVIIPIGRWVLQTVCQQAVTWQEQRMPPLKLAVNISGAQFNRPDLIPEITQVLDQTGLPPRYLSLELTESLLVQNVESTINTLNELHARGLQVSVDDFGTGYASLGYLQHFSFNTLKLDRCFVKQVNQNTKNAAIVMALIQMAHSLDLDVIAEGVETEDERDFLAMHRCDAMQGYLFSRPLPALEFAQLVTRCQVAVDVSFR